MKVKTYHVLNAWTFVLVAFFFSGCLVAKVKAMKYDPDEVIDLSRKGLKEIPAYVFERKNLKSLRLFKNELAELPPEIALLENLEELYLGNNLLTTLPPEIKQLKKLRILSIQYNKIETLPEEIGELSALEEI